MGGSATQAPQHPLGRSCCNLIEWPTAGQITANSPLLASNFGAFDEKLLSRYIFDANDDGEFISHQVYFSSLFFTSALLAA